MSRGTPARAASTCRPHPDHVATHSLLRTALRRYCEPIHVWLYEVWTPLFPNCLVRIDSTMPLKKTALMKYESQLAEADYLHACVGLNAHRSAGLLESRNGYAEAFHISSLAEYREHYTQYCASR